MDGKDIQAWNRSLEKADELGLLIVVVGNDFAITKSGKNYGHVGTISELLAFMNGYDWAKSGY